LTHAAEKGASTLMLMALSGHASVRSLARYAKVSAEALAAGRPRPIPPPGGDSDCRRLFNLGLARTDQTWTIARRRDTTMREHLLTDLQPH